MFEYFNKDTHLFIDSIIGTTFIIGVIILYTRIFGLKSFSKMTGYDFIITLIIGNVAGMALSTGRPGLVMGAFILGLAFLINYLLTFFRYHSKPIEKALGNDPILLMENGKIIEENLKKSKVTMAELKGKLREANVLQLHQAKAVVLETTGDVSVLHSANETEIDAFILDDVIH